MKTLRNMRDELMAQMRAAVFELVQQGPCMIKDLCAELGCTTNTVRKHLIDLEQHGHITHTRQNRLGAGGFQDVWHLHGVIIESSKRYARPVSRAVRIEQEKAVAPSIARDPLLAAFFGPARKEAA